MTERKCFEDILVGYLRRYFEKRDNLKASQFRAYWEQAQRDELTQQ